MMTTLDTCVVRFEASWPMGHRLQNHDGKCKGIHGHTYRMLAEFSGAVSRDRGAPTEGMVADFSEVKRVVRVVTEDMDHALMLQFGDPAIEAVGKYAKVLPVAWPPTAERIAFWILDSLVRYAPEGTRCTGVTVWESDATCAEARP